MVPFIDFFFHSGVQGQHLHGSHDPGLVLLSLFVSIVSATMALHTAQIVRQTESRLYRHVAIATGAIALGGGIWTMHFIGMLALELPVRLSFSIGLTLASLIPAGIASWLALHRLARPTVTRRQLVLSGTLVGMGIGTMHYCGMAAIEAPPQVYYDPLMFLVSLVVAVALAILALWVRYGLRQTPLDRLQRLLASGAVMGVAIASMHYTGMSAAYFIGDPTHQDRGMFIDATVASLVLSSFTITVTVMVMAVNGLLRARELNRVLHEGRTRERAVLDTAVDGIIGIDARGLIQSVNKSVERLFGWRADELIGRNISMLMPEPDQSNHDGYLRNYRNGGRPKVIGIGRDVEGKRKDGSLLPMRLAVGRVDLGGEPLFVGFVSDLSERKALESSLRETAERAEQAAAAKSIFLANMSHEIRTPMNSVIGFTELLLQTDLTTTQRNHLNTIHQSATSLLGVLNDVLDTTKMEKGRLELERVDFSLKGLGAQVESSLRLGALSKGLVLAVVYPEDMPEHFHGDPLRTLQILTNLVGNAIKFTERGQVDLVFGRNHGSVCIEVRDTGIGMPLQQIESVFSPFSQGDASISRRFGGTGLGTTIARQLVELMGGQIEVESELGLGTTFRVRLPLGMARCAPPTEPESANAGEGLPSLRVLIADDVMQNLELLELRLLAGGHDVQTARDGGEAFEKFVGGEFDVVLMDVHMPGTDGLQAVRLIRQHERLHARAPTPVIALTASVMEEDRRAARQAGMNGFAVKPLNMPALLNEISLVLNLKAQMRDIAPSATEGQIVDWEQGVSLWGTKEALTMAIDQFLASLGAKLPLPAPDASDIDWEQVAFSLHGLRGAAGNMGMPTVAAQAGLAESLVREGRHGEARLQLRILDTLIAQVRAQVAGLSVAATPNAQLAGEPMPVGDLVASMHVLRDVLAHNQLDDATLQTVCGGLELNDERQHAQALRSLIESFEFVQAQVLLDTLIAEHESLVPSSGVQVHVVG